MISFVSYVLRFKNDDSAIGDVARDIADDNNISRRWGYKKLINHLKNMNAADRIFNILNDANTEYNNEKTNTVERIYYILDFYVRQL